jgi:hypothetical protein
MELGCHGRRRLTPLNTSAAPRKLQAQPLRPPCTPQPPKICQTWPQFDTAADLAASPWGDYFSDPWLYGELPPASMYPLSIGDWWMLDDGLVAKHGVTLPPSAGNCAPPKCSLNLYTENNMYAPPKTQWIWHAPPYTAFSGWVEVTHQKDPFGDEHFGAWFLYAKGSGVWFQIGKVISFGEHYEAFA